MKLHSVRVRLTMLNMGVLALVLLVLLVAVHYSVRGFLLTTIDRQLAHTGAMAAQAEQRVSANPELRAALAPHRALLRQVRLPSPHVSRHPHVRCPGSRHRYARANARLSAQPAWDARALAQSAAGRQLFSTVREDNTQLRILLAADAAQGRSPG